jgi:hypothetical protein
MELVAVEQSHRRVEPGTTTMSRRRRQVPAVLLVVVVVVGALASRREEPAAAAEVGVAPRSAMVLQAERYVWTSRSGGHQLSQAG